ncbi:ATP-binding cassette domain-containing protein [Agromyces sp. MMS17-SY077]|uniref:ATP-binding cassette domain-containing protein n=1 Tax=Agromyces seonyuensis TaxID=2662446 RepID=A0A6I4NVN0_9MICO|nr:ATP-binding cassette domain-containing protein [Agromyces seonyuensis]
MVTAAAIEVAGLAFRYPGADDESLRGVDLRIEAGDFVAVVGGNGSGKSTLCKTFNGLVPHFWDGDFAGEVRVFGEDTLESSVSALGRDVGYVAQDFGNQLVRPTVREDVAFAPINFGLEDWPARTEAALEALDLGPIADRFTWQLSGGQQHLTAIAGAIAVAPRVLIVDEPVAEVDPERADDVYRHLERLNREHGITIVVIEHHAEFVARYARSVVLMEDGRVRWHLPVREALGRARDLEAAHIPVPPVAALVRALDPDAPVPLTVEETLAWVGANAEVAPAAGTEAASVPESASDPAVERAVVASVRGARHSYRTVVGPRVPVLDGVDLDLRDGERVALVGGNGAGKSTLLSLLSGLLVPQAGTVVVDGVDTRASTPAALADHVALLGQRPGEMFLTDSVRGDVAMFPAGRGAPDADDLVDEVLDRFALRPFADRDGRLLSGGQQRRVTLAIGLAMRPKLLLLDEPTSSLDLRSRDDVVALLAALADRIRCVAVATHDMHLVAEWADRVVVLEAGRVAADLAPAELFDDPELLRRARLVPPQITEVGRGLGVRPLPLSLDELLERLVLRPVGAVA